MATTVGETAADFLNFNLHMGLGKTSFLMSGFLIVALAFQMYQKKYVPWIYWVAVVLISVVGTLITDNLVDNMDVSLKVATPIFSVILAAVFIGWYVIEKTLSIHSINTSRRELFYWLAILFTFALGTSAGDLVSEDYGLGYLTSAGIFGVAIAVIAAAYYTFKANATACFWIAYVLTRPFGASCGDYLSQGAKYGGLGLGTINTSIVFLFIILALVIYLTLMEKKRKALS